MALPNTPFGDMVKKFTDASQSCHDLLSSERTKSWHTAAFAKYALVALQYPRFGANRQFRCPAIADMTAFLAISPRNRRPKPEPRQDEDDESDEMHWISPALIPLRCPREATSFCIQKHESLRRLDFLCKQSQILVG
ncbi:uncharacterized protein N7496_003328 [Penicillium cataractarum]|uniref:Uncharacterized protein n=1 Tax=Penicillium cataractarum TaxID=2100454 RepID=A0A9W9SM37_9EURO|nr:uncharacterized protein N7496_003328 [Penicillium cataractarum]KAJ5380900.1 hypothetical protein N7496_003328 [Penicillium cataractarum]